MFVGTSFCLQIVYSKVRHFYGRFSVHAQMFSIIILQYVLIVMKGSTVFSKKI